MRERVIGLAVSALILAASVPVFAAGAKDQLMPDLVQVEDGRFVYDDLSICQFNLPSGPSRKFQLRSQATAPSEGLLSRDRFVALIATTEYSLALAMSERAIGVQTFSRALGALDCDPLEEPIGTVDVEIKTTMTQDGMQVEVINTTTKEVTRSTRTWEEIYD